MPRLPKLLPLLLGILLGCASARPPSPPDLTPDQQRLHRLLVDLHLPQYAERLQDVALRVAGHPRDGHLAEDQRLRPRIEAQLDPEALVLDVVRRAAERLDASTLAEVDRFYASPTGRKVVDASGVAYSWLSRLGYRMFGGFASQTSERVALVQRLEAVTLTYQTTGELYLRVHAAIVRWYEAKGFIEPDEVKETGGIEGLLARERERVTALAEQQRVRFSLYAFGDLSTPELTEYATFLESPPGRAYAKAVREALSAAVDGRAAAIER